LGTNPTLYAQTKIVPAGRFTVAFHIQIKVYELNMEIRSAPAVIIVMANEANSFPALADYVKTNYQIYKTYPRMTLYLLKNSVYYPSGLQ
jgi:hypothetical protein